METIPKTTRFILTWSPFLFILLLFMMIPPRLMSSPEHIKQKRYQLSSISHVERNFILATLVAIVSNGGRALSAIIISTITTIHPTIPKALNRRNHKSGPFRLLKKFLYLLFNIITPRLYLVHTVLL